MIICQCNVLSEKQVLDILTANPVTSTSSAAQVYGCLGCKPECGRCVKEVKRLIREHNLSCELACKLCPAGHAEPANDETSPFLPDQIAV
jgi:bacterioferritin-associated ferredoxin